MATKTYREKVFPALAGALWLTFLFLDLSGAADSTWVKFAAISLCAATAWTGARTPDGKLVAIALTLTVCADVFLLLLNRDAADQMIGVGIFIAVQLLYAYRLYLLRGKVSSRWGLPLRLALAALCLLAALGLSCCVWPVGSRDGQQFGPADLASCLRDALRLALPLVYFSNLCVNCAEAFALCGRKALGEKGSGPAQAQAPDPGLTGVWGADRAQCGNPIPAADRRGKKSPKALGEKGLRRFAWGLLLFIGCDVCVGAWNLGLFENFSQVGMWFFYLPSQVLITLSPTFSREKK